MFASRRLWAALFVATLAVSAAALGAAVLVSAPHGSSVSPIGVSATSAHSPASASTHGGQPVAPGPVAAANLLAAAKADHVNPTTFFPPNLVSAPTVKDGVIVHPSYSQAPEPAGLASYGVLNATGTPTAITINTTSYKATLGLSSLLPYYLATGAPESFTSQLNVVVTNVTLFGNDSYSFWAQNVLHYDAFSGQFQMENNIWNFTNTAFAMPQQTFYHGAPPGNNYTRGTDNALGTENYYYIFANLFNGIYAPMTTVFYINTTTYENVTSTTYYSEIDFDYQLLNGAGVQIENGMFDRVLFNNTGFPGAIPNPHIHIDGSNLTGTGFIPYDAEIMLGGPGGGSTATFDQLNATMTLQHWDSTLGAYVNEPSAWSVASETGETAVGVAEYYTSDDVAHLGAGPEFAQPFWNSSATAAAGAAELSGTISPSNAWAFVTNGATYNYTTAAWGALPPSGNYAWNLTAGTYTVKIMASNYDAVTSSTLTLAANTNTAYSIPLTADVTAGVYAPLYAWSNAQLAAISSGGSGTSASPYMIVNDEYTNLSAEFAATNDYGYPAYPGISLAYTNAYVDIVNAAPFAVTFWGPSLLTATHFNTPTSDDLATWLFATSHVSILDSTFSGWFTSQATGFPYANILLWNSTSTLIAGSTFEVNSQAILTYGGTGNWILNNSFLNAPLTGFSILAPVVYGTTLEGAGLPAPLAINENEGGDTIVNNYVATPFTAWSSNQNTYDDSYPSVPATYNNSWNLSAPIVSGTTLTANGITVTLNAIGGFPWACGNWWADYQPGVTALPYDEFLFGFEFINNGGDYCPAGSLGTAVFVESGLPSGTSWSVTVGAASVAGTTVSQSWVAAAGLYAYTVGAVAGYSAAPSSGTFGVTALGGVTTVTISFTSTAPTSGTISGTVTPTTATVWIDGATVSVSSGAFTKSSVGVGTHSIEATAAGYYPYYNNVTVTGGGTSTVTISLNPVTPPIGPDGTLSLAVSPATASVWVDGTMVTLSSGAYSSSETPGAHSVEVTESGYYSYYNNVSVSSSTTSSLTVTLNPVVPPVGPDGTLSISIVQPPSGASLWVDGAQVALTGSSYSASLTPGVHTVEVSAPNYYTYYNNVTVKSGTTSSVSVTLNAVGSSSSSSSSSSGISTNAWIIIGVLAALAIILLITTLVFAGRSKKGSSSMSDNDNSGSGGSS